MSFSRRRIKSPLHDLRWNLARCPTCSRCKTQSVQSSTPCPPSTLSTITVRCTPLTLRCVLSRLCCPPAPCKYHRSVVRFIGAINSVSSRLLSRPCNNRNRFSSCPLPGGTPHPSLKPCCPMYHDAPAPSASRVLGRLRCGRRALLRSMHGLASTARADSVYVLSIPSHCIPSPAPRPPPIGRLPALHRAEAASRAIECAAALLYAHGVVTHEACRTRFHRCGDAVRGCGSAGATYKYSA